MNKKILLVEYASSSIDIIKEILAHPLFEITLANEGESAKKLLSKQQFDLMITAAMLPKFHGFSLSHFAAQTYPGIKIIITSHIYKGVEYKHQATSQYGADDFFEVPFDKTAFKNRVYELLDIQSGSVDTMTESAESNKPVADTRKIPTLEKLAEEEKKLSSEDLFGDIIEKVHEIPTYEIKLNEDSGPVPILSRANEDSLKPAVGKDDLPPVTQKIDLELMGLLNKEKAESPASSKSKYKKIEDDISKKFEETLTGLGIDAGEKKTKKPPVPKSPKTSTMEEPIKETGISLEIDGKKSPAKSPDQLSGYELLGLIGRGGMAEIYKAKKKGVKGFEKVIALKKILSGYGQDLKYIEMFVDEAKIAAELTHPNIVQIYDLGHKDDYYFIAMEYVQGKDLRLILQKMTANRLHMPEELTVYLVIKVLEALNYAHSARDSKRKKLDIVHRDVSPPNILVSYNGNIKLTDFGVSKASIKMHQTLAGALKGKLLYMSPEQARGEEDIDNRSDLYSVGTILFELLTDEKLFMSSSEIVTLKKVQEGKIIKPSQFKKDIDPQLEAIVLKALDKDIENRYQKASDMIKDLDRYMITHYESMPESSHIAYFMYTLFKDDIAEEGLELNIKPIAHPIRRIERQQHSPVEKKETPAPVPKHPRKPKAEPESQSPIPLETAEPEPEPVPEEESGEQIFDLSDELIIPEIPPGKTTPTIPVNKHQQEPPQESEPETLLTLDPTLELDPVPQPLLVEEPELEPEVELEPELELESEPESLGLAVTDPEMTPPEKGEEEFQPVIEINFDDDLKEPEPEPEPTPDTEPMEILPPKPEKPDIPDVPEIELEPDTRLQPELSPVDALGPEKTGTGKKKKGLLFVLLAVIVILAAVIVYFLVLGGPADPSQPGSPTAGDSGTEMQSQDQIKTVTAGAGEIPGEIPVTADTQPDDDIFDDSNLKGQSLDDDFPRQPDKTINQEESPGQLGTGNEKELENRLQQPQDNQKKSDKQKTDKQEDVKETPADESKDPQRDPASISIKEQEITEPPADKSTKPVEEETQKQEETQTAADPVKKPETTDTSPAAKSEAQPPPPVEEKPVAKIKEGDILSPTEVDSNATPVSTPPIKLTRNIRRLLVSDQRILVSFLVDHKGSVETVKLIQKSKLKRLNNLITETIKKWKYTPAVKDNVNVKVWKNKWITIKK